MDSPALPQLAELTKEEFEQLIADGKTMNLRDINRLLHRAHVTAGDLQAFGVDMRRDRNAVHIRTESFAPFCQQLSCHMAVVAHTYKHQPQS